jgi:hypothetical protein
MRNDGVPVAHPAPEILIESIKSQMWSPVYAAAGALVGDYWGEYISVAAASRLRARFVSHGIRLPCLEASLCWRGLLVSVVVFVLFSRGRHLPHRRWRLFDDHASLGGRREIFLFASSLFGVGRNVRLSGGKSMGTAHWICRLILALRLDHAAIQNTTSGSQQELAGPDGIGFESQKRRIHRCLAF